MDSFQTVRSLLAGHWIIFWSNSEFMATKSEPCNYIYFLFSLPPKGKLSESALNAQNFDWWCKLYKNWKCSLACCDEKNITFSKIIENDINPQKQYIWLIIALIKNVCIQSTQWCSMNQSMTIYLLHVLKVFQFCGHNNSHLCIILYPFWGNISQEV